MNTTLHFDATPTRPATMPVAKMLFPFEGRLPRKPFWLYAVLLPSAVAMLVLASATVLMHYIGVSGGNVAEWVTPLLLTIYGLIWMVMSWIQLAAMTKRLHDQDLSGWHVLLTLVPFMGGIAFLIFACSKGTDGGNRFGRDTRRLF